jgi:uncharacterized membrane protein YfcA
VSWESLAVIAFGLGAGALCKGATGMGLPLIALPVLASFLTLPHAIAVLTVPVFVSNAWQVWSYRSSWRDALFLPRLVVFSVIGLAIGTAFLKAAPPAGMSLTLGSILAAYLALRVFRPSLQLSDLAGRRFAPAIGVLAGAVQGATGVSSPVLASFLSSLRLKRQSYVFAISMMFLLFAGLQLPALAVAGLVRWAWLFEGLLALVPVAVMMPIGSYLGRRLGQLVFDRIVLIFIAAMTLRFLLEGLV